MQKQLVISDWLAGRRSSAVGVVRDEGFKECSDLLLLTTPSATRARLISCVAAVTCNSSSSPGSQHH
jgi:hypothetical protein